MKKSFAIFIIVSLMLGSFLTVKQDKNGRVSYNKFKNRLHKIIEMNYYFSNELIIYPFISI